MVNDDVLIKYVRANLDKNNWPDIVVGMKERLKELKLGFPGIGNDHLSLIKASQLNTGDIFIYDVDLASWDKRKTDEAPIMMRILDDCGNVMIEGIGYGVDSKRDPYRLNIRWGDVKPFPPPEIITQDTPVYRVDARPTLGSGPAYYYFFKSYRDFRV